MLHLNRRFFNRVLTSAAVVAAALHLGGVSAQEQPVAGGTLNLLVQPEPPSLMLGLNQLGPTQFAAGKIYQSLLTYGPDLKPLPSLAVSWSISPDGLNYTFQLQKDVKWHDGKPFSSATSSSPPTSFCARCTRACVR